MAAWAQWVWSSTHWCWECSTLSTGGAKLAPYGEWALRWRDWSPYAYGSRHNAELKTRKMNFFRSIIFWVFSMFTCPTFRGQPRCTWVIALPDSTRRLCLATKVFSSKRRKLTYLILYIAVLTHLIVRASLFWERDFYFWKKRNSWKKCFWQRKYFQRKIFLFIVR
jgi:hypothetical protein